MNHFEKCNFRSSKYFAFYFCTISNSLIVLYMHRLSLGGCVGKHGCYGNSRAKEEYGSFLWLIDAYNSTCDLETLLVATEPDVRIVFGIHYSRDNGLIFVLPIRAVEPDVEVRVNMFGIFS